MSHVSRFMWRFSILLLPWQTRFFIDGPLVNGWPWEQGRMSFYLSWLPMLATIAFAMSRYSDNSLRLPLAARGSDRSDSSPCGKGRLGGVIVGCLLFFLPLVFTISPRATIQWLMEFIVIFCFAIALMRLRVTRMEFTTWFILSLIPHALLAIWQYQTQMIEGIKWLGISPQNPLTLGVSVIEAAGSRILRAYGGFPHPNILGGWLAVALTILFSSKQAKYPLALTAVFSSALVLTFSRAAWMAAAVGFLFIFLKERRLRVGALLTLFAAVIFTGWMTRAPLFVRTNPSARLESKSMDERAFAWKQGWELFREHPLVGVGPGSTILALSQKEPWNKNDTTIGPPVPPHNVPQLALIEFGVLGLLGIFFLIRLFLIPHLTLHATRYTFYALFLLSLLDHYPWSLWSGKSLAAAVLLLTFLP